jgi:hypothetical protein
VLLELFDEVLLRMGWLWLGPWVCMGWVSRFRVMSFYYEIGDRRFWMGCGPLAVRRYHLRILR